MSYVEHTKNLDLIKIIQVFLKLCDLWRLAPMDGCMGWWVDEKGHVKSPKIK